MVEITDEDLAQAQDALGTETVQATVAAAMREAVASVACRREVEVWASGRFADLRTQRSGQPCGVGRNPSRGRAPMRFSAGLLCHRSARDVPTR